MEYTTNDIAAARSLQFATYIHMSMATFWTYDYACSLHEEWTFLLRSRWSKMKGLYIVTRYLPFIFLATDIYLYFTPNLNPGKCWVWVHIDLGIGMLLVVCSDYFFILRTYVLWNKNKILLAAMLFTFVSFLVACFGVAFATTIPAAYVTSTIPGITGCYRSSTNYQLFIPFLLLSVFELGLMILTLIRAIQDWRANQSRLYVVRVNHNISYYACGFLFSVTNVATILLFQDSYQTILYGFQYMILAILATRMHLHLWQVNRHPHGSTSTLVHVISDMSFANPTE
ncbi:uncharacterized protein F5147DRAFT_22157 [Suillus discolor]|uniref:DUF6533 domain-containing protein n=1 Tax=Suillus discolor TaxID=1912936 RepID=A0A9P7FEN6_9AGAM|nr:uncharacterized protein F5147DRAFT_22157 [Suillus discolor]KAG2114287.1 hypothetical protein F5147DRAFT_22157 [Suillus discolor]